MWFWSSVYLLLPCGAASFVRLPSRWYAAALQQVTLDVLSYHCRAGDADTEALIAREIPSMDVSAGNTA